MNLAQTLLRKIPRSHSILSPIQLCQKSTKGAPSSSSSSSSSDSDDEKKPKVSRNDAVNRLNSLLQKIVTDSSQTSNIELARPSNKRAAGRKQKEETTIEPAEKKVVEAVKNVAESLGGNTKQTESELLMKLLNPTENYNVNNLSSILKGMKIEREPKPQQSKAEQIRTVLQNVSSRARFQERPSTQRKPKRSAPVLEESKPQPVELFTGDKLNIFTNPSELKDSPQLSTWQKLHEKELKLAVTHPPTNYFQQMILWTEQGKLWQFPINNEFGLEKESKVYFADHVFLEDHLEPWCPPKGPIRHFMELVCVGLSKNSYLTVEAKKEHIEWYKNYFEDKKKLLQEVGAIQAGPKAKPESIDKE